MKTILALVLLVSATANANPVDLTTVGQPICYGREYSQKHMAESPLQTVKAMTFTFSKDTEESDGLMLFITASVKVPMISAENEKPVYVYAPYYQSMGCSKDGDTLFCGIDCDGGSGVVSWSVQGSAEQITFTNNGFVMYGGCGVAVPKEVYIEAKAGGDDIFVLNRMPSDSCPVNDF